MSHTPLPGEVKPTYSAAAMAARREYNRKYRAKNAEKLKAYQKAWRAANRDRIELYNIKYWERKAQEGGGADDK